MLRVPRATQTSQVISLATAAQVLLERVLAAAPAALFRPNGRGAVRTVDDRAVARKIAGQLFDAREELAAHGAPVVRLDQNA